MVPFHRGKPTGEYQLGLAIHQIRHLAGLCRPVRSLLQIGRMPDQDRISLAQKGGLFSWFSPPSFSKSGDNDWSLTRNSLATS